MTLTSRAKHKRRLLRRINTWLKTARDGLHCVVDSRENDDSPDIHFLR